MMRKDGNRKCEAVSILVTLKNPSILLYHGKLLEKIWLKQPKAASALDFSYFQHASKLVTHHKEPQPKGCGSFFAA